MWRYYDFFTSCTLECIKWKVVWKMKWQFHPNHSNNVFITLAKRSSIFKTFLFFSLLFRLDFKDPAQRRRRREEFSQKKSEMLSFSFLWWNILFLHKESTGAQVLSDNINEINMFSARFKSFLDFLLILSFFKILSHYFFINFI